MLTTKVLCHSLLMKNLFHMNFTKLLSHLYYPMGCLCDLFNYIINVIASDGDNWNHSNVIHVVSLFNFGYSLYYYSSPFPVNPGHNLISSVPAYYLLQMCADYITPIFFLFPFLFHPLIIKLIWQSHYTNSLSQCYPPVLLIRVKQASFSKILDNEHHQLTN